MWKKHKKMSYIYIRFRETKIRSEIRNKTRTKEKKKIKTQDRFMWVFTVSIYT